jgi:hypothetical protein
MIQWREGKLDDARAALAQANQYVDDHPIEGFASSWLGRSMIEIMRREAEELIAVES